jgi:hypothetical protein
MEELFDNVYDFARSLMLSTEPPRQNLYNLGINYPSRENFKLQHFVYHVQIDLNFIQPVRIFLY